MNEPITPSSSDRAAFGLDKPLPAYTECPACGQHTEIIGYMPHILDVERLARAMTEASPNGPGIRAEAEAIAREYEKLRTPEGEG